MPFTASTENPLLSPHPALPYFDRLRRRRLTLDHSLVILTEFKLLNFLAALLLIVVFALYRLHHFWHLRLLHHHLGTVTSIAPHHCEASELVVLPLSGNGPEVRIIGIWHLARTIVAF